ncbi:hypothetical protein LEP48_06255 [Isoptericola sp. NEAU-Y5]|uniref:Uncharacterized protein n=1 Tax=Isoptericola luteus TaxID=2879484 RepID=A0ABS7ZF80_9MICO|nr:hypothetical protein [Isoptericola sp. NEAU-Y5]MCA5892956.1 hypothetical protein [Isoptericola sp. NEAU-Y5]
MSEHDAGTPEQSSEERRAPVTPTPSDAGTAATTPVGARRRGPRRAVRKGTERESVPGVARDERGGHGSNDERLRRDVPPHW